jgi:hypothetical protein
MKGKESRRGREEKKLNVLEVLTLNPLLFEFASSPTYFIVIEGVYVLQSI